MHPHAYRMDPVHKCGSFIFSLEAKVSTPDLTLKWEHSLLKYLCGKAHLVLYDRILEAMSGSVFNFPAKCVIEIVMFNLSATSHTSAAILLLRHSLLKYLCGKAHLVLYDRILEAMSGSVFNFPAKCVIEIVMFNLSARSYTSAAILLLSSDLIPPISQM